MMLPLTWQTHRLTVRDAVPDDVDAVMGFLAESAEIAELDPTFGPAPRAEIVDLVARSASEAQRGLRDFQMQLFALRGSGDVAGYWHLTRIPQRAQAIGVSILLVRPAHRRAGLGQELVSSAAAHLAGTHQEFWSRVFLRNTPALAFWAGLGFDRLVRHKGQFVLPPAASPSVVLMKPLGASDGIGP